MKIFVDENIPSITVKHLRSKGFDVTDIRGTPDQGMIDELLWKRTQKEKRLLITTDKGFTIYRHEAHYGILHTTQAADPIKNSSAYHVGDNKIFGARLAQLVGCNA